MSLERQIALILICWILAFISIRSLLSGIIAYQLNSSASKKRKKGQTFAEWFLYARYRKEIPKILLLLYFVIAFGHPSVLLACLILHLVGPYPEIGGILAKGAGCFDIVWTVIYALMFWSRDSAPAYSRWIKKKRGMPPKKKK